MKLLALPVILLTFIWYVVPAQAPEGRTMAQVNEIADSFAIALQGSPWDFNNDQSVAHKRQRKLYYDRIEVGVEPVRVQRCKTPGTIWYQNACWRPERIIANAR